MGMKKDFIMGIDPGNSGAIALMSLRGDEYFTFKLEDMTERDIFECIRDYSECVMKAYIEKVQLMPTNNKFKNGKKSAWVLSGSYHGLRMALLANDVPFDAVPPTVWQSKLKCRTGGDKKISRARAQQLFPKVKIIHANADSLLIAEYGRLKERL